MVVSFKSMRPLRLAIVEGLDVSDNRLGNVPGADAGLARAARHSRKPQDWRRSLDLIEWGLIPYWCDEPKGGRKPINAKAETVSRLPMFRDAYAQRRCIVPVDGFFQWRAIKGARARQPYAIAMKDGSPSVSLACRRTGASRMGRLGTYLRHHHRAVERARRSNPQPDARDPSTWKLPALARSRLDPHDLLITYPSEPDDDWPISTRVNKPENDEPSLLDRTGDAFDVCGPP